MCLLRNFIRMGSFCDRRFLRVTNFGTFLLKRKVLTKVTANCRIYNTVLNKKSG